MQDAPTLDDEPRTVDELPDYWRDVIRKLRVENSKMRRERNDYRTRLEAIENLMPWKAAAAQAQANV